MNMYGNQYANPYYNNPAMANMNPQGQFQMNNQVPQQPAQQTQATESNCNFIAVNNVQQVLDFVMKPDTKAYFLDMNLPLMYTKTANTFGITETKAYNVTEVPIESLMQTSSNTDVVSRSEYEKLLQEVTAMKAMMEEKKQPEPNKNQNNNQRRDRNESVAGKH